LLRIEDIIFLVPALICFKILAIKINMKCQKCNSNIISPEYIRIGYCRKCNKSPEFFNRVFELQQKTKINNFTEIKFLQRRISSKKVKGNILDIGCGNCSFLSRFKNNGYLNLTGFDQSFSALRLAKRKSGQSLNLVAGNSRNVPFKDQSFDTITCLEMITNTKDYETIDEISRIMKRGSIFYVSIPNQWGPYSSEYNVPCSDKDFTQILKQRFDILEKECVGLYIPFVTKTFKYLSYLFSVDFSLGGPLNISVLKPFASHHLLTCKSRGKIK